jgi:SAM-dependent methyltransferase
MNQAPQHHPSRLELEAIEACPICGGQKLRSKFDVRHITDDPLHCFALELDYSIASIIACLECGFLFKRNQPSAANLRQLYANSNDGYLESIAEEHAGIREDFRVARQLLYEAFPRGGSILDLGCASGFFLESLGKNWDRQGLEVSALAAERSRRRSGILVHQCEIARAGFDQESFDVVSSFDVIEHLSNPMPMFREARRILKPGGWFLIGTGDAGSFAARASGSRWTYMCIPEHLSFFNPRSLSKGVAKAGFSQVNFRRIHHGERSRASASGWLRGVGKHWAVELFGEDVLRLSIFRQKTPEFLVPYFFDHMLCIAR